ncbi:Ltp family lipoprotein [Actinoplanes sp. NPDC000266]
MDRVGVLVIAALPEEFEAARTAGLADGSSGVLRWEDRGLDGVPPFLWGEYRVDGKTRFTVALARPTRMGGRVAGQFAASLVYRLRPAFLAMCGVCAGNPADTALGDVVVGNPVYEWDEGKHSDSGFQGDHRQYSLESGWVRAAQDLDISTMAGQGDASEDEALLWFLEQLFRGQQPRNHPARSRYFPAGTWRPRLDRLEERGWIRREPSGEAVLTSEGSDVVRRRLYDDVDGPERLPFRVLTAPMASGSAVVADAGIWDRLQVMGIRKIAAVEMEAATIATVADEHGIPWLVAKGVMDHADTGKDDRYKRFAAHASARVMFALLERLAPTAGLPATEPVADAHTVPAEEPTPEPVAMPAVVKPLAVQNAVRSAWDYLQFSGFSRKGLIAQLSSDAGGGYSVEEATLAVDSLGVDFNEQAVRSAKNFLSISGFSRKGLIAQLSSDAGGGYSVEEATLAVDSLGVDFNEQAVRSAKDYLAFSGFSRRGLIAQLESDAGGGYTHSQAVHGVEKAGL